MKTFISFLILLIAVSVCAENYLNDPYLILNKNYWAIGGDKILEQTTVYAEGTVEIDSVSAVYKYIYTLPSYEREDVIIDSVLYSSGFNNEYEWHKFGEESSTVRSDSNTLNYYKYNGELRKYTFLQKNSPDFKLYFDGMENIDGVQYYIVRMTNTIDGGVDSFFVHSRTFYVKKHISNHIGARIIAMYDNYLDIGGVKRPFDIRYISGDEIININIDKYEVYLDDIDLSIYGPAEE